MAAYNNGRASSRSAQQRTHPAYRTSVQPAVRDVEPVQFGPIAHRYSLSDVQSNAKTSPVHARRASRTSHDPQAGPALDPTMLSNTNQRVNHSTSTASFMGNATGEVKTRLNTERGKLVSIPRVQPIAAMRQTLAPTMTSSPRAARAKSAALLTAHQHTTSASSHRPHRPSQEIQSANASTGSAGRQAYFNHTNCIEKSPAVLLSQTKDHSAVKSINRSQVDEQGLPQSIVSQSFIKAMQQQEEQQLLREEEERLQQHQLLLQQQQQQKQQPQQHLQQLQQHQHPAFTKGKIGKEQSRLKKSGITIHVIDETRQSKKDFVCDRNLLVTEMKYFADHLSDPAKVDGIEISIHCDVKVFEWLFSFIEARKYPDALVPELTPKIVISILVSSEFLQMPDLVNQCLEYCRENINKVVKSPSNLNGLTSKLLTRLAMMFSLTELDAIVDRKDRFISKVFWKRLECVFEESQDVTLFQCSRCHRVLNEAYAYRTRCENGGQVDYRGKITYGHVPDPDWDINSYLAQLRLSGHSSKTIFWRVLGLIHFVECIVCQDWFPMIEYQLCKRCPKPLSSLLDMAKNDNKDEHLSHMTVKKTCCGAVSPVFTLTPSFDGCTLHNHEVAPLDTFLSELLQCIKNNAGAAQDISRDFTKLNIFKDDETACGILQDDTPKTTDPTLPEKPISRRQSAYKRKPQTPVINYEQMRKENLNVVFSNKQGFVEPETAMESVKHASDVKRAYDGSRMVDMSQYLAMPREMSGSECINRQRLRGQMGPFNSIDAREQAIAHTMLQKARLQSENERRQRRAEFRKL